MDFRFFNFTCFSQFCIFFFMYFFYFDDSFFLTGPIILKLYTYNIFSFVVWRFLLLLFLFISCLAKFFFVVVLLVCTSNIMFIIFRLSISLLFSYNSSIYVPVHTMYVVSCNYLWFTSFAYGLRYCLRHTNSSLFCYRSYFIHNSFSPNQITHGPCHTPSTVHIYSLSFFLSLVFLHIPLMFMHRNKMKNHC